jgi:hypothetical protein
MMKIVGFLAVALFSAAGCGNSDDASPDGCASGVVGSWMGTTQNDRITISGNKSFKYSGVDGCVSQGSFGCPDASVTSGTMRVTIDSSSGGSCLPAGAYTCAFALNGNAMGYDCIGTGLLQYKR